MPKKTTVFHSKHMKLNWFWIKLHSKSDANAQALVKLSLDLECEPRGNAGIQKIYDWLDDNRIEDGFRKIVRELELKYHYQKSMPRQCPLFDLQSTNGGGGSTMTPVKVKKRLAGKIKGRSVFTDSNLLLDLPLKTVSEANSFEHWTKKHARHKSQQKMVSLFLKPLRDKIKLPCKVTLTRFSPNKLDKHDNLPMSFKYIVDAVCSIITGNFISGKADSDERISIVYDQVTSKEYGIRIEVTW